MSILVPASNELRASFPRASTLVLFHPPQDVGLMAPYAWELLDAQGNVLAARGPWAETATLLGLVLEIGEEGSGASIRDGAWLKLPLR